MSRMLSDVNEDDLFGSLKQKVSTEAGTDSGSSGSSSSSSTVSKPQRSKQLIILVGPQGVSMDSTLDFFIHHMSQYRPRQHLEALDGWIWPAIELPPKNNDNVDWMPVMSHRQMLDLLIQSNNDDLRLSILQQINATWAASSSFSINRNNTESNSSTSSSVHKDTGMVLGSTLWDEDPTIVYEIVSFLQVPPKDVSVIWVHPSSRYHQWQTLFHESLYDNYTQWMCDPNETPFHLERLDTSLNAMRYATALSAWGINGVVIDQRGVLERQLSIPHSIACRVMTGVPCHNGWVEGLDPVVVEDYNQQQQQQGTPSHMESPISWLEQVELEGLLADRDCYYRTYLLHGSSRFRHLFPSHLWADCEHEDAEYPNPNLQESSTTTSNNDVPSNQYYESLVNTTYLWEQLRNNVPCQDKVQNKTSMPPTTRIGDEGSPLNASSDVEKRVESSLQSSARAGIWTVSVFFSLMALWIGVLRRHRRRVRQRRNEESKVLRQWNHDDAEHHQFDLSTVKVCHVSGRYDDEDDEDFVEFYPAHSSQSTRRGPVTATHRSRDHHDEEEPSSTESIRRLSYRDEDFDEIDLQDMSSTNHCSGILI